MSKKIITKASNFSRCLVLNTKQSLSKIPERWKYVTACFVAVKIGVTLAGYFAVVVFQPIINNDITAADIDRQNSISTNRTINMWFQWDAHLYQYVAKSDFKKPVHVNNVEEVYNDPSQVDTASKLTRFALPPLYPVLTKAIAKLPVINTASAALIVTNVSLLACIYFLFMLGERIFKQTLGSKLLVKYCLLLPAGFMLQAAQSESLFMALSLACLYYAIDRKWLLVGVIGFFAATTRSVGFLLIIPCLIIALEQSRFSLNKKAIITYLKTLPYISLIPLGWFSVMLYGYVMTGDLFIYQKVQSAGWNVVTENPFSSLLEGLGEYSYISTRAWVALVFMIILSLGFFIRKISLSFTLYGMVLLLLYLSLGPVQSFTSIIRYSATLFPVAIILTYFILLIRSNNKSAGDTLDTVLTIVLALLQGVFLSIWVNYPTTYII